MSKRPAKEARRERPRPGNTVAGPPAAARQTVRSALHELQRTAGNTAVRRIADEPLDADTRLAMEARLGTDLGDVRVHADDGADAEVSHMGAAAFTRGPSVTFSAGMYQPETEAGRFVLAHELAHVIQQTRNTGPSLGSPALEAEADATAVHGQPVVGSAAPGSAQYLSRGEHGPASGLSPYGPDPARTRKEQVKQALEMGSDGPEIAFGILDAVETNELLTILFELGREGVGLETMTYLQQLREHVEEAEKRGLLRVAAAVVAASMGASGMRTATGGDLAALAKALADLPGRVQLAILGSLGLSPDAAEGIIATISSAAKKVGPDAAVAFGTGLWEAGSMPGGMYVGLSAHFAIGEFYRSAHPGGGALIFSNVVPVGTILEAVSELLNFTPTKNLPQIAAVTRPDIFDGNPLLVGVPAYVYEIKPWSLVEVAELEVLAYTAALDIAHIPAFPGPSNEPGTFGSVEGPGGWFVFESPVPGVIAYQLFRSSKQELAERRARERAKEQKKSSADKLAAAEALGLTGGALVLFGVLVEALEGGLWIIIFA